MNDGSDEELLKNSVKDADGEYTPTQRTWKSIDYGPINYNFAQTAFFDISEIQVGSYNITIDEDSFGLSRLFGKQRVLSFYNIMSNRRFTELIWLFKFEAGQERRFIRTYMLSNGFK